MYNVIYSESARRDLKNMDLHTAQRIIKKILFFSQQKNISNFSKPIIGLGENLFRFRIGDYRAIFKIDRKGKIQILLILKIKHRKDIYN